MIFYKKIKFLILLLFFLNSCTSLPGINKNPVKKKINKDKINTQYSMKDIGINIININSLSKNEINKFNQTKIEEIDYKVNKFSKIYNYKYEYILGPADSVSINLTDTDDIDNTYLIDQKGMIALPFIGKVKFIFH